MSTVVGRAARWRKFTKTLRSRLDEKQLSALRRARQGYPPEFKLGWYSYADTGDALDAPLRTIEGIARELLRGYDWPRPESNSAWPASGYREQLSPDQWCPVGPDWSPDVHRGVLKYEVGDDRVCPKHDADGNQIEGDPDFRLELLTMVQLVVELRASVRGGHVESAILRAMTIGTLFGRLASMAFDGPEIASGATSEKSKKRHIRRVSRTRVNIGMSGSPRSTGLSRAYLRG